jgi:hypothetical protein
VDAAGNAYVTGQTTSVTFPTTAGAFQTAASTGGDAFVTKLGPAGTGPIYSTYLGGAGADAGNGIAIDGSGNAYVTGSTTSLDFPTTTGAFQTAPPRGGDAFVAKLNAAGSALVYSTFLGGAGADAGNSIAVDAAGDAFVTGSTVSPNFPTTGGALQTAAPGGGDAFVTKLNAAGSAALYSTYLGGSGADVGTSLTLDAAGNAYVTGSTASTDFPTTAGVVQPLAVGSTNAFVTKLNAAGSAAVYSTYLGGLGTNVGNGIALDAANEAFVTGTTTSLTFPVTVGAFQIAEAGGTDAFVTKLNATATALGYSTYLGGAGDDAGAGIKVDASGNAFVTGSTASANFPTANNPVQANFGGTTDAFVTKLNAAGGALVYSTYLGGGGADMGNSLALDGGGDAYVAGTTDSTNLPLANPLQNAIAGGTDLLLARLSEVGPLTYTAPAGAAHVMTLSLVGPLVTLLDNGVVVRTKALASTTQVQVSGANGFSNTLTVDNNSGGLIALPGNPIPAIVFTGGTGAGANNSLVVTGTPAADVPVATTTYVFVNNQQFTVFTNTQAVTLQGGAGDIGFLFDGAGNNTLTASPTSASLPTGGGLTLTASNFPQVRTFAGSGQDTANLSDSTGVDEFVGTPGYAYLTGTAVTFLNLVSGFRTVNATATTAGDFALLFDSAGTDTFTASPTTASLTNGTGYTLTANGFVNVRASSQGGGDVATLTDSAAADTFRSTSAYTFLGSNSGSYLNLALGFATYNATGSSSTGPDTADLYDTPGNDTFTQGVPDADGGQLTTPNYTVNISKFGTVRITSSLGGVDVFVPGVINYSFSKVGPWV